MRRGNCTGSVYKDKDSTHKKKVYRVRVSITDKTGATKRISLGRYATQKEAQRALADYLDKHGEVQYKEAMTFGEVWGLYVDEYRKKNTKDKVSIWNTLAKACAPFWNKDVSQVRTAHLQKVIDDLGGAPRSMQLRKTTLVSVMNIAVREDLAAKNYASYIKVPQIEKSTLHKSLTGAELRTLWSNVDMVEVQYMLIYIYTGLRVSELLAIKTDDIHIGKRYMVGGLKTKAGRNRVIPIAGCIAPFVKALYTRSRFRDTIGAALFSETYMRQLLQRTCERLGLERHTTHDFRHTFLTLCANNGVDPYTMRAIAGHAQQGVTEQVYIHKTVEQLIQAVDRLPYGADMSLYEGECIELQSNV